METASLTCAANHFGPCGGPVCYHYAEWYCNRRCEKDTTYTAKKIYNDRLTIMLCGTHYNKICVHNYGRLPMLYGYDEEAALDSLTSSLQYTGPTVHMCTNCTFRQQKYLQESEACTKMCSSMLNWYTPCDCKETIECTCSSFNNNAIHWAILTYGNGFLYDTDYQCWACVRPSWRDEHTEYFKALVDIKEIISMAKENPNLLLEKNAENANPLELIDYVVETLTASTAEHNTYAKCREDGCARYNIGCLAHLKTELIEVLDAFAN